jgi:DNA-binding NarL/FixJ family response regulator
MRETVVIVDDNEGFRLFTKALLRGLGYEVVGEAADGHSALDTTRRLRPDVLLLDVQLPGLDGIAVARRLGENANCATVVVLTSARDRADYGCSIDDCGARGFIAKADLSGQTFAAALAS